MISHQLDICSISPLKYGPITHSNVTFFSLLTLAVMDQWQGKNPSLILLQSQGCKSSSCQILARHLERLERHQSKLIAHQSKAHCAILSNSCSFKATADGSQYLSRPHFPFMMLTSLFSNFSNCWSIAITMVLTPNKMFLQISVDTVVIKLMNSMGTTEFSTSTRKSDPESNLLSNV